MLHRFLATALQFLLFVAVGTLVALPSLHYPWHWDDLHLIRTFTTDELMLSWHQTWDFDGLETIGYRPLTVLFNHTRASLFGEVMAAHRLFLITMFAVYLVLVGLVARRFGLSRAAITLAGIMVLCAKYSSYHFVWVSDGVHIAQGVLFALAALAILRWVESTSQRWFWGSLLAVVASILVREDSLGVLPVLVLMAAVRSRQTGRWAAQRNVLFGYAAVLMAIAVSAFLARDLILVGEVAPLRTSAVDFFKYLAGVITLAGWRPRIWILLFLGVFALALLVVRRCREEETQAAWLWLFAAVLSCSPGLVETRVNLLFFPITFYCLFVSHVIVLLATGRAAVPGAWAIAVAVALVCIGVPARESRLQQLSMAPGSIDHLETSCDVALDGEWSTVTAPARRTQIMLELGRLELNREICQSLLNPARRVADDATLPPAVFVPPRRFLSR